MEEEAAVREATKIVASLERTVAANHRAWQAARAKHLTSRRVLEEARRVQQETVAALAAARAREAAE